MGLFDCLFEIIFNEVKSIRQHKRAVSIRALVQFPPTAISKTSLSHINKIHYAQYLSYTYLYTDYALQIKTS